MDAAPDFSLRHATLVPFDGRFRLADRSTEPPDGAPKKGANQQAMSAAVKAVRQKVFMRSSL